MSNPLVKACVSMVTAVSARNGTRQVVEERDAGSGPQPSARIAVVARVGRLRVASIANAGGQSVCVKKRICDAHQMSPSPTERKAIQPATE
jgi:hypothetical protein